jgi:hypothetical protein
MSTLSSGAVCRGKRALPSTPVARTESSSSTPSRLRARLRAAMQPRRRIGPASGRDELFFYSAGAAPRARIRTAALAGSGRVHCGSKTCVDHREVMYNGLPPPPAAPPAACPAGVIAQQRKRPPSPCLILVWHVWGWDRIGTPVAAPRTALILRRRQWKERPPTGPARPVC